jgi:RNA polymerase sigma factor (sigma-70 family)
MTPLFARQQDPARAFERLYKAHVHDVYRYALMVLRNREDAEDVVQMTFLKAYRVFARGERPRNARPWLITIAHNTCRTRQRDAKRRPQEVAFEERVAESLETPADDAVEPKELLRALGALSFNQRSALVMRELEGRSYTEIARILELTPSAVETLLFRARRAVREQLEGALTCGEAEHALSLDLDGRLAKREKTHLRAHLRACDECASLARRQRARRAALRGLGPVPLPGSLAAWGGGTAAGTGIAAKVAAVVAAGAAAVGAGYEVAEAVPRPAAHGSPAVAAQQAAALQPAFALASALGQPALAHVVTASGEAVPVVIGPLPLPPFMAPPFAVALGAPSSAGGVGAASAPLAGASVAAATLGSAASLVVTKGSQLVVTNGSQIVVTLPNGAVPLPAVTVPGVQVPPLVTVTVAGTTVSTPTVVTPPLSVSVPVSSVTLPAVPAPLPDVPNVSVEPPALPPPPTLPAPTLPVPTLPAPTLPAPTPPPPTIAAPTIAAPTVSAPTVAAPTVPAPTLPSPTLPASTVPSLP